MIFFVLCLSTATQIDLILHTAAVFCFSGGNWYILPPVVPLCTA